MRTAEHVSETSVWFVQKKISFIHKWESIQTEEEERLSTRDFVVNTCRVDNHE